MAWMKLHESFLKIPELLFSGEFSFTFDEVPIPAKKLSRKQITNLFMLGMDTVLKRENLLAYPPILQIEPANICNLKCPLCPTGNGVMKREKGFMSMETYKRVLDEIGDYLLLTILYGWGEPFLHKEMAAMIKACTERNICTITSTNGQCIQTMDEALAIIDAGLTALIIAVDGSSQETYEIYRKSGDFEKVKNCVTLIEKAKTKRGVKFPYTNLRIVVNKTNENDVPEVEKLAKDLGVNMFSYRGLGCLNESKDFKDYESKKDGIARYTDEEKIPFRKCTYPFRQPTVFWDGTLVGCEHDYDLVAPWGKIGEKPFKEMWNSAEAIKIRKGILGGGLNLPSFCGRCPFQKSIHDSFVLSHKEFYK